MQLVIIGTLDGQIGAASQIAIKRGAKVQQADTSEAGLELLRKGGADLVMIDVKLDVDAFGVELTRFLQVRVGNRDSAAAKVQLSNFSAYVDMQREVAEAIDYAAASSMTAK